MRIKAECPYFDAKKESSCIKKAIDANKLILGICLGAQLVGEALGAPFAHSPNKEIGVFDVNLTSDGKHDLLFSAFPETFPVAHWHGDMPGLTPDARILAYSEGCPRQIVRYTPKIWGFQCHFEFTPESVEGMILHNAKELEDGKLLPYVQNADTLKKQNYNAANQLLFKFLNQFEKSYEP